MEVLWTLSQCRTLNPWPRWDLDPELFTRKLTGRRSSSWKEAWSKTIRGANPRHELWPLLSGFLPLWLDSLTPVYAPGLGNHTIDHFYYKWLPTALSHKTLCLCLKSHTAPLFSLPHSMGLSFCKFLFNCVVTISHRQNTFLFVEIAKSLHCFQRS